MFNQKLELLMNENNIKSIKELARQSDIPYTTLIRMVNNGIDNSETKNVSKLANYFNCTIDYLQDNKISINDSFYKYKNHYELWLKAGIHNDNKEKILNKIPTEIYKYLELDYWYHPNEEEINKGINDYSNDYVLFKALISMGLLEEGIELTEDILKNIIDFILLNVTIIKNLLCKEKEKFLKTIKK